MNQNQILKYCLEEGILLDREVLNIFTESMDFESAKLIITKIREQTNKKLITKDLFDNKEKVNQIFSTLSDDKKENLEKLKIKMGIEVEISRETHSINNEDNSKKNTDFSKFKFGNNLNKSNLKGEISKKDNFEQENKIKSKGIKTKSFITTLKKKPDIDDFIKHFRNRFVKLRGILNSHSNLTNLVSINKISGNRQGISIIGMVSEKRVTKNGNILLTLEDLTDSIKILINKNREELYKKCEDISIDSVIGVKGSGSREIIFVNDVVFPDSVLFKRKKSPEEEYVLFIGDFHYGSQLFLEENFKKFVEYLKGKISDDPEIKKIKYIFVVGDIVSGVGVYPNQESQLNVKDLESQFKGISDLLSQIPKDIQIIICPGNHDGVRIMEPQPIFDKKYAWPIYELENVKVVTNPSYITFGIKDNFSGFNLLMYHGFSFPFYSDNVPSLITADAINSPDKIMKYLLKNRHLAPTHSSVQYYPFEEDPLLINDIPDIFFAGHTHKMAVSYYNNILLISCSSWESISSYQERLGNKPDFCKVPMFNLKTREIKILDFEK